ncbi:M24 family metallopeptidase [Pseudonocardia sp. NPDC049635]|uniref:M24 family metallopeptidase n=1 Tax=Pseudonocardia sp. NPDC049635 TaxID=3155506 RepID=UPI003411A626
MIALEQARIDALRESERKAGVLFETAAGRGLIAAGATEQEVSDGVRDLARELFGIDRFWHKRIVRTGRNTLSPYRENPPDLTITDDDIVFVDFGPIFEEWEADFGRTYVVGDDPAKHRLAADLSRLWEDGRRRFLEQEDVTGEQLYRYVLGRIAQAGWEHPETHAGHLVGEFPHERIEGDRRGSYITDGNTAPLRRTASSGRVCRWILEIHIVDRAGGFGGFVEQLLDI